MTIFSRILEQYGEEAVLHSGAENRPVRIFLQPVSKPPNGAQTTMTRLGEDRGGTYRYFGPPDADLAHYEQMTVALHGKTYRFLRAEPFWLRGACSH